jgi:hypothetical protein
MTFGLAGLVFLLVIGGLIALGVRAARRREKGDETPGADIIAYLLLALAVGAAGFSLAALARAALTPGQLAGRPTGAIAGALAGLVVATPIAFLLWRRQARRRSTFPAASGWPAYLAVIELVFLTAFFVAVTQVADAIAGNTGHADWTDLLVYGGIVAFHWWAERREPPSGDDIRELPRLIGSGVALIALASGLIGTLAWLLSLLYDAVWGGIDVPDPAIPIGLLLAGAPIWGWRWLPSWDGEPGLLRRFYLGLATASFLTMAVGALVVVVATLLTYFTDGDGATDHFAHYPLTLAFLIVGLGLWQHHRLRLGEGRSGARRGYAYTMAAVGLATLVGSATALVEAAFTPTLAGTDSTEGLIALACAVIASGWVWLHFWRQSQRAPRQEEVTALPRRVYLIGMAIALGLTAAGALIGALVVLFRALLGEVDTDADTLRLTVTLTLLAGLATWHLVDQIRDDGVGREKVQGRPYTVTVICSHPGNLAALFPAEATLRVIYRGDGAGTIDEEMASAIVTSVGGTSSLVWVDETGFRTAPARGT